MSRTDKCRGAQGTVKAASNSRPPRQLLRALLYLLHLYMLLAYGKSEQDDLTPKQLKQLKTLVEREFES